MYNGIMTIEIEFEPGFDAKDTGARNLVGEVIDRTGGYVNHSQWNEDRTVARVRTGIPLAAAQLLTVLPGVFKDTVTPGGDYVSFCGAVRIDYTLEREQ